MQSIIRSFFCNGYVLAFIAGCQITLALAPFNIWPLALFSSALLYLLLQRITLKQAVLRGWLFGFGLFLTGASWVYVSIHDYGAASVPLAIFLMLVFVAGLALFFALQAWCWVYLFRQAPHSLVNALAFSVLWVIGEVFRGWFLTGFPWLYVGYSQLDGPFSGLAPVGGVWLLSFYVVLCAVLLTQLIVSTAARRQWALYAGLFVALLFAALLLKPLAWTQAAGEPLSVVAVQGNIEQNLKWDPEELGRQLHLYRQLTQNSRHADLIVWPETAVPLLQDTAQDYLDTLDTLAQRRNAALITGIPIRHYDEQGQSRFYNGITTRGQASGEYLKQKLVPFGEYVPLQDMLRGVIAFFDLPMSDFVRGPNGQPPLQAKGYRIAPYICYEVVYPEFATKLAAQSEILLTISNDTWFGTSIGPLQHLQMARMRALESGRWMIRATNNGVTAIIDPRGQIDQQIPQFEQALLYGSVVPMQGLTPYLRFGSWPLITLCLLLLAVTFVRRMHKKSDATMIKE